MKKRMNAFAGKKRTAMLLATACGLVSTAHVARAQSSVQLYGVIDAWAGATSRPSVKSAWEGGSGGMSTSYFGFKGAEDLGGGWKTIFELDAFFQPQNGVAGSHTGDPFFGRHAFVGLKSAQYGTFTMGRNTTPLFLSTILFNPFIDSYAFSPIVNHTFLGTSTFPGFRTDQGVIGDSAWNNTVSYASPSFNGLTVGALYGFGDVAGSDGSHKDSFYLTYFRGPLAVNVVYQYVNFKTAPLDFTTPGATGTIAGLQSQTVGEAAASYDLKFVKLYGQAMTTFNEVTGGSYHVNTGQLGLSVPIGSGFVLASYAYSRDAGGFEQTRKTASVGYDYYLSSRTDLYVSYMDDRVTAESAGQTYGAGIRTRF
jgi:predicted porin